MLQIASLLLMIYTGLRRAEVVALCWYDIDFEDQLVTVRHGKGDKERIAAIADMTDETMNAETILRVVSGSGRRIGIERLSAHDLRRTHITLALNNNVPLHDMQAK